jgi:hypothetical protein
MKKLISKFKSLNLPLKCGVIIGLLWLIPFIETFIYGFSGWYDLPIHTIILLGLGCLVFAYLFFKLFIFPVGLWVINLFKKKK